LQYAPNGSHPFNICLNHISVPYNLNHTRIYLNNKTIDIPPIQDHIMEYQVIESEQYSEYKDMSTTPEIIDFEYEPMIAQLNMMIKAIRDNNYSKLNNGLDVLRVFKEIGI